MAADLHISFAAMNSSNTSTSSEEKKEHNSTCSQSLFEDQDYVRGLIEMGLKALKSDDKTQLLDFFRRSEGLRAKHYGNLALKFAQVYYVYGSKFLQRARGNFDIGAKKVSEATCNEGNLEQGADDKDQEEYQIKYDDSHLRLALYALNAAKELIEEQPEMFVKAKIFKALGDVFLTIGLYSPKAFGELVAKGSFEQSVSYYEKVLSMWPQMVEPHSCSMPRLILEIIRTLKTEYGIAEFISFVEKATPKFKGYMDQLIKEMKEHIGFLPTANESTSNYRFPVSFAESGHFILNMKEEMDLPDNILQLLKEKYVRVIVIPKDNPSIVSDPIAAMAAEEKSQREVETLQKTESSQ